MSSELKSDISLTITLSEASKKFNNSWVFKNLSYTFEGNNKYAILGANGSGKSTLLQILSGYLSLSKGNISFHNGTKKIDSDSIYKQIGWCAPSVEIPDDFTLTELIKFHSNFKNPILSSLEMIELLELEKAKDIQLKNYSSGMRQRVKLGLCLLFESNLLLLDEPSSHLDKNSILWYKDLVSTYSRNRLLIISSNQEEEYEMCELKLSIEDYK